LAHRSRLSFVRAYFNVTQLSFTLITEILTFLSSQRIKS
jgi:hypothetical protein